MSVFDDLKTGLTQAIEYEKGNLNADTKTLSGTPTEEFLTSEMDSAQGSKEHRD